MSEVDMSVLAKIETILEDGIYTCAGRETPFSLASKITSLLAPELEKAKKWDEACKAHPWLDRDELNRNMELIEEMKERNKHPYRK
jgi:hypothetical protein